MRETLDSIARDMTDPRGGFWSASDADSPGPDGEEIEGYSFTWTPGEIEAVLGKKRGVLVEASYGVSERGDLDGRSIVRHVSDVPEDARKQLLSARSKRAPAAIDRKIIPFWNGLMITAPLLCPRQSPGRLPRKRACARARSLAISRRMPRASRIALFGFAAKPILTALLVNAAWGLGTGLFLRFLPGRALHRKPIRFLTLGPDSAIAALEWFPLVATRSHPLKRRVIRVAPLRDQGVAGSNPVSPISNEVQTAFLPRFSIFRASRETFSGVNRG